MAATTLSTRPAELVRRTTLPVQARTETSGAGTPPPSRPGSQASFEDADIPNWYLEHIVHGTAIPAGARASFSVGDKHVTVENGRITRG